MKKTRPKYGFKTFISKNLPLHHTNKERNPIIGGFYPGDKIFYHRNDGTLRVGIFHFIVNDEIWAFWGDTYETLNSFTQWVGKARVYLDCPENEHLKRFNPQDTF